MWLPRITADSTMASDTPPRPMSCASREHLLGERVAQVVVQAVVEDHQVAHRIGGAQQRRQREVEQRGVDEGEQRALGIVGRQADAGRRPARAPARSAKPMPDRPIIEMSLSSIVISCRKPRLADGRARGATVIALTSTPSSRVSVDAHDAVLRRHVERVAARRGLDAGHALRVAAIGGGRRPRRLRGRRRRRPAARPASSCTSARNWPSGVDVDRHRRSLAAVAGARVATAPARVGGAGAGACRIEIAAERDAVAGAADDRVLEQCARAREPARR